MPKPDAAHLQTDKKLTELEKRIARVYEEARADLNDEVTEYFSNFRKRDEEYHKLVDAGKITEEEYKQWRLAQIGRGKRFEALRDKMAERYTQANEVAISYTNDATPGIYSLNRNYTAYTIEKTGADVDFTLFDEQTVKRLIVEEPNLMPYYPPQRALKRGIDLEYGKKQITKNVTSGILMGKSVGKLANDLQRDITNMNRASALRTARTAITGAQNAGRQDGFVAAEKMGIELVKEWIATLDNRTRHAHQILDGQEQPTDKPFKVDGEEIMFPGDTSAPGYLVYNCFVGDTKVAADSKIVSSYKHEYHGELVKVKTASGVNFTCTPNHPILTPSGWVSAASLNNGDNLLVTFGGNRRIGFSRQRNINHIHSSMKALYDALHCVGLMSRNSTLRVNFHGDVPTTDVEVITKKWLLRNDGDSCCGKRINKFLLVNSNKAFMSQSAAVKHFRRVCLAAFSFIRERCKTLSFLFCGLFHSCVHRFRTVSNVNFILPEYTIDNLPAETEIRSELLNGLPSKVFLDHVVRIEISSAHCHVYNLQTKNGYYFVTNSISHNAGKCNGNVAVIAKNCRCTVAAHPKNIDVSDAKRRARDPDTGRNELVQNMTYTEWEKSKLSKEKPKKVKKESAVEEIMGINIAPADILPVNNITDYKKFGALVYDFEHDGYSGRPIVAVDMGDGTYQALTGSHRIFAAREAGIDIPTVVVDYNDGVEKLIDVRDDIDRAEIAKKLYKNGKIEKDAYRLLSYENEKNDVVNEEAKSIMEKKAELYKLEKEAKEKAAKEAAEAAKIAKEKEAVERAKAAAESAEMAEYKSFLKEITDKYGEENMWSDMTDAEMSKLDNLERIAYKGR